MMSDQIRHRNPRPVNTLAGAGLLCAVLACLVGPAAGCRNATRPLTLDHLTPAERLYVERVVAVERAKAVALVYRENGEALLDSLAAAWGDSAAPAALRGLSGDPSRAVVFNDLLLRVVSAEQESLLQVPGRNRLQSPLPSPPPDRD